MTFSLMAAAALANGLLIGLIPTFVDSIPSSLKARLNLPDGRVEWFGRLFYLAWLPMMPLAGWLLDAWPNRDVLLYGGLLPLILGTAWLALARTAAPLLVNAVLLGSAYSFLTVATIRWMTVAFFPEYVDRYPLNIASLNFGFVAVGSGAILGPWVVVAIERWSGARQGLLYMSIAMLGPAVMTALCESTSFPPTAVNPAPWSDLVTHPQLVMIAIVILIYFALENCLEYWPEAYLKQIGYEGSGAHVGVFVFWLVFVASRAVAAWWFYEHPEHGAIMTLILLGVSALILGNLAGGFEYGSGSFGFWLLGVCYGPLLPGLLGIALDLYPQSNPLSSGVFGLLLALSGFDILIARPVLNKFTKDRPARSVMFVPTILALIAGAILLMLAFIRF